MPDDEPDRNAHSPQLDEPLRSRERAALDIAAEALKHIASFSLGWESLSAQNALDKVAALVPDAVE